MCIYQFILNNLNGKICSLILSFYEFFVSQPVFHTVNMFKHQNDSILNQLFMIDKSLQKLQ